MEGWDWLEYGALSTSDDAELIANPIGDRLYAVWSQEDYNQRGVLKSVDAWFRRVFSNLYD